jgi:ribosomal protein L11 methylase PrmA
MSALGQQALLDNLRRTVSGLRWRPEGQWIDYGTLTSYTERAAASKRSIVARLLAATEGRSVWDLGANVGTYSGVAAEAGRRVLAFDLDPGSVERHWLALDDAGRTAILPLVMDLTNPSPGLGWNLAERRSLVDRGPADVLLALALIHHLAIGNNVPLPMLASFLARLGRWLIIEFVPKQDPMVQGLLATRPDVFPGYTLDGFRSALEREFRVAESVPIDDSLRTLILAERR